MTVEELQAELTQLVASGKLKPDSQVFVTDFRENDVNIFQLEVSASFGIPSVTIQY